MRSLTYTPQESIAFTLYIGGTLAFIAALITFSGLRKGRAKEHEEKRPFLENMRVGITEIRKSPRLLLGCGAKRRQRRRLLALL